MRSAKPFVSIVLLSMVLYSLAPAPRARAAAVEPGERFQIRMVSPIENNSGVSVWGSKYYPGDVLSEKMSDYVFRKLSEAPRVNATRLVSGTPDFWPTGGFSESDMIVRINLEEFNYKKKDMLGSKVYWDVVLHTYVYNGSTRGIIFDSIVREKDTRQYVLYNDALDTEPIYWDKFEKSPYWPAIRSALDQALSEVLDGYNGYRVVGQIVAKAERVDGSLSVPSKKQDNLYHVNLGRADSIKVGDILVVTRSSSVRTIAPETPEMHFPQIVGRVRVVFVKDLDSIVEIVKESAMGPIQLGDSISAPLYGRRDGKTF
jgi:hypothetical protein